MDKKVFREVEAAGYICMSRSFLSQDRAYGTLKNRTPGPKYIKIGRAVRYLKEDLDLWLEQQREKPRGLSSTLRSIDWALKIKEVCRCK